MLLRLVELFGARYAAISFVLDMVKCISGQPAVRIRILNLQDSVCSLKGQ